jgi:hypothetical protein
VGLELEVSLSLPFKKNNKEKWVDAMHSLVVKVSQANQPRKPSPVSFSVIAACCTDPTHAHRNRTCLSPRWFEPFGHICKQNLALPTRIAACAMKKHPAVARKSCVENALKLFSLAGSDSTVDISWENALQSYITNEVQWEKCLIKLQTTRSKCVLWYKPRLRRPVPLATYREITSNPLRWHDF